MTDLARLCVFGAFNASSRRRSRSLAAFGVGAFVLRIGWWLCVPELYEHPIHVEIGVTTDDLAIRPEVVDLAVWKLDATIGRWHRSEWTVIRALSDELRHDRVSRVVVLRLGDLGIRKRVCHPFA